jgi:peptide/nickel transport system substrate-binding protein
MVLAVVVILLVVVASGAAYVFLGKGSQTTTTNTSSNTTNTSTTTPTTTAPLRTSLTVDEQTPPDSLDPARTYETSGWEPVEQIYQMLISYNDTSFTTYEGVLAKSWSVSSNFMNYTFNLRTGVTFSNGDPFNAYVEWYSVYRTIIMNQAPAWILNQNLIAGGPSLTVTDAMLNSMSYTNPSASNLSVMMNPNQSVSVINASAIQFNLGYGYNGAAPYSAFLATLVTPMAAAVDPAYVKLHGGVVANSTNDFMATNAMGTGFYELQSMVGSQSLSLVKNPNYWADSLPKSQLNNAIAPAILNNIVFYYKDPTVSVSDLRSGSAQMVSVPVTYYNITSAIGGVTTTALSVLYGASEDTHYIYMDPYAFAPFGNLQVREAIASAIDYNNVIKLAFDGHAEQWIGPVPPGWQYYNESTVGLSPYQYDPVKAATLLAQAGYISHLPNGTTLNPSGQAFPSVQFLYDADNPTDLTAAQIVQNNLNSIGISVQLVSLPFKTYANVLAQKDLVDTPYAMGFGYYSEDYTASIDYVTYFAATPQVGQGGYANAQVSAWNTEAANANNSATIISDFKQITQAMYQNYTDIWMYVPQLLAVKQSGITGIIPNPAGSGMGYFMYYNTVEFSS